SRFSTPCASSFLPRPHAPISSIDCEAPWVKRAKKMPLHRDIYWVGKQWSVTGHGMQAIDQKLKGEFDIEVSRLWDDGLHDELRDEKWFNAGDFDKGLAVARQHYPEPPGRTAPKTKAALAPAVPA